MAARATMIPLEYQSISELSGALRRRQLSPVDLLGVFLERIERLNPTLNAYLSLMPTAMREAERQARKLARREPVGALAGIPISIKDLILSRESLTTAGSRAFGEGLASAVDAPVVRRLRRAGAVIVGRTNLHEVALGVTTVNEHFGPARNPRDPARVAGGSSGGSAVAVAAGLCTASVGTDTRGSIRIPAACCGITGLKPTYGLVPVDGVIPLSPSLDHVGPMTRSVEDAAIMLGVMGGGRGALAAYAHACRRRVKRLRVGVSDAHMQDLDAGVQRPIEAAIAELGRLGASVRSVRTGVEGAQLASAVITASEAVAFHDRALKSVPDAFGPLVRQRLEGGYQWTAVDYLRAMALRERVRAMFDAVFSDVDVLVGAVLPAFPPRIGEHAVSINGHEANTVESFTRLNALQNMGGVPALSIPCGADAAGLPVGLQLIAARAREELLFSLGAAFQRETNWHENRPC
jgi:aspartyl-tRNA(Asn)/glutamyl-tRNA(Gln) amidotransferase subunit A